MPPDAGAIEIKVNKMETIAYLEHYFTIFSEFSTLIRLGLDFPVERWMVATSLKVKKFDDWHFLFGTC